MGVGGRGDTILYRTVRKGRFYKVTFARRLMEVKEGTVRLSGGRTSYLVCWSIIRRVCVAQLDGGEIESDKDDQEVTGKHRKIHRRKLKVCIHSCCLDIITHSTFFCPKILPLWIISYMITLLTDLKSFGF